MCFRFGQCSVKEEDPAEFHGFNRGIAITTENTEKWKALVLIKMLDFIGLGEELEHLLIPSGLLVFVPET